MVDDEKRKLAENIMSTGRMIHERMIRLQCGQLENGEKSGRLDGLSLAQLHTMMTIQNHGRLSMSELSERMGVSPPSASAMVDRLVEKGILTRKHSTNDRRKVMVSISATFVKDIRQIQDNILFPFVDLVEKIGHETAEHWCDVLDKLKSALIEAQ